MKNKQNTNHKFIAYFNGLFIYAVDVPVVETFPISEKLLT